MRLIDADALWKDIIHSMDYCEDILKFIDDAPTVDAPTVDGWIPCSEKLPEENKPILLCFRSAKDTPHWRVQVGYLGFHDVEDNNFQKIGVAQVWYTDRFYWGFDKVFAWMPLPKPYKEDENEEVE